jgi:hypothetical protein
MNNFLKSVFMILLGLLLSNAQAQVCPLSIETVDAMRSIPSGWDSSPPLGTVAHALLGVDIIYGKLDHDDPGNDGILRPIDEANGDYFWSFPTLVGNNEIWMLCIYSDSSVRLERRVDRTVRECRSTKSASSKHKEKKTVSVVCK